MTRLSVNINKIATLRNSRGGNNPNLVQVAKDCEAFGAEGITVHPRPDERHIRYKDVYDLKQNITTEFNIEGNPKEEKFVELVLANQPAQVTLVPDALNQLTSDHGWDTIKEQAYLKEIITRFKKAGIRVSIFVDPNEAMVEAAATTGTDRIELYTESYAKAFEAWYAGVGKSGSCWSAIESATIMASFIGQRVKDFNIGSDNPADTPQTPEDVQEPPAVEEDLLGPSIERAAVLEEFISRGAAIIGFDHSDSSYSSISSYYESLVRKNNASFVFDKAFQDNYVNQFIAVASPTMDIIKLNDTYQKSLFDKIASILLSSKGKIILAFFKFLIFLYIFFSSLIFILLA